MASINSFDRPLIKRIKDYMDSNKVITVDDMAEYLQNLYRSDYGRRKKKAFRGMVERIYYDILRHEEKAAGVKRKPSEKSMDSNKSDKKRRSQKNTDIQTDIDFEPQYYDNNRLNNSLSLLYTDSPLPSPDVNTLKSPASFDVKQNVVLLSHNIAKNFETVQSEPYYIDKTPSMPTSKGVEVRNSSNAEFFTPTADDKNKHAEKNPSSETLKSKQSSKRKARRLLQSSSKREHNKDDIQEDILPKTKKTFNIQEYVSTTFADIGGDQEMFGELKKMLLHLTHPEIYQELGVTPPCGLLLYGPPGCGKTLLGKSIAGQLSIPLIYVVGTELVGGMSGESEQRVRDLFDCAKENSPCVLFLDEIDAIAQPRENSSKDMERRIVSQLLASIDDMKKECHGVLFVGATNRLENLDMSLRRAGRFDKELCLGIPGQDCRESILRILCKKCKLVNDFDYKLISHLTPGYVGADLSSLCREAAVSAVSRVLNDDEYSQNQYQEDLVNYCSGKTPETNNIKKTIPKETLDSLFISLDDFKDSIKHIVPTTKREGFATIPDVTWDDIGALENIRDELSIAILGPVRNPDLFKSLGLQRAGGILLAGPPGCGKTLLAKAIANETGINFISVKGPELLNMYVGESERAVRRCFERARISSPCVIFFDELDSLCPRRSSAESGASARVVNQMLTELDGLNIRREVFVIAATNRPDIIDPAVLRPGRLDKTLYVGIPTADDRVKILNTITKNGTKPEFTDDVCLENIANDNRCSYFTGADLSLLVREASLQALRKNMNAQWNHITDNNNNSKEISVKVSLNNFEYAFNKVKSSISPEDRKMYSEMASRI